MVTINRYPEEVVDLYYNEVFVATINESELFDVREQICVNSLEGYSIKVKDDFYKIDVDGMFEDWDEDLFSTIRTLLFKYAKTRAAKKNERQ
jgi:hypothetical protein